MAQTQLGLFQRTRIGRWMYGRIGNYRWSPFLTGIPGGHFRAQVSTPCATFDPTTLEVGEPVNVASDWDPNEPSVSATLAGVAAARRVGGLLVGTEGGNAGFPRHPGAAPIAYPLPLVANGTVAVEIGAETAAINFGDDTDIVMLSDGTVLGTAVAGGDALGRVDQSTDVELSITVTIP